MLISESNLSQPRVMIVMSEIAILAATVKTTLAEIAKQANALAVGLQNAAPADRANTPNNSVQYLLHTHDSLVKLAEECEKLLNEVTQQNV